MKLLSKQDMSLYQGGRQMTDAEFDTLASIYMCVAMMCHDAGVDPAQAIYLCALAEENSITPN